jgi:M6 family metalloprotease-like protein
MPALSCREIVANALCLAALNVLGIAPTFGHGESAEDGIVTADANARSAPIATLTGTAEEIAVDDRVNRATHRYFELRLAGGGLIALRGSLADRLSAGAHVEVTGRRNGKSFSIETIRATPTPRNSTAANEQLSTIEVEGTLAIAHTDDFAVGRSEYIFEILEDSGNRRRLELASLPGVLRPGMRISVEGRPSVDGSTLRPVRIAILAVGPEAAGGGKRSSIPQKSVNTVLVVMANFNNTAVPSFTPVQAQQVVTSDPSSVTNYYGEVSFGQQTLDVTVTNWVTMNISKPATCNNSDWQGIGTAASSAATAANSAWNSSNYGFVVYLFPQVSACGWNGLAYIGSPHRAYINGTNSFVTQVIAHEMGHNFGLLHAGSLGCPGAPIGGTCTVAEYGDPFDTMGNQRAMHFNAEQKRKLNWISAASVATHITGSATYTLAPIESPGGALYAVKIPTASPNRTYWIEFRQPIGFDSPLSAYPNNGAQVRVANPFETYCLDCDSYSNDTELLDMTPGTSAFTDSALVVGSTFHDSVGRVTIHVQNASPTALTLDVDTDRAAPPADFDSSGTMDLIWRNTGNGITSVSLMNGVSQTESGALTSDPNWVAIATGDFNGDGRADLVWRNSVTGQTAIWFMNGVTPAGTFTVPLPAGWSVTHTGDFNGDGRTDLVVRNASTGETGIWLIDGSTVLSSNIIYSDPNWTVSHIGDFDGNGKDDLVWHNSATGQSAIWLMNGTSAASTALLAAPVAWQVVQVGDLNGDGRSDLVWHNTVTGQAAVWLMNGAAGTSAAILPAPAQWTVTQIADLDGDGNDDLIWRHDITGQTAVWLMNGTAASSVAVIFGNAQWSVLLAGDTNNDGNADLVWRNSSTGATAIWLMNGLSASTAAVISTDANLIVQPIIVP